MKDVWKMHNNDLFARGLEAGWRVIEKASFGRVHDEATAPKLVRFFGFLYLLIAVCNWLVPKL